MRTQLYGLADMERLAEWPNETARYWHPERCPQSRDIRLGYSEHRALIDQSRHSVEKDRSNGDERDRPGEKFPGDGTCRWTIGEVRGNKVYGEDYKRCYYKYELRYDAGEKDRIWFEKQDRNYLERILQKGKLRKLEPDVWYLWGKETGQKGSLADWWSQKIMEPNIKKLLQKAAFSEKGLVPNEEPPWEKAERLHREQKKREAQKRAKSQYYRCPLSQKIMLNPCMAADGETYEREKIELWFQANDTSPVTKQKLPKNNDGKPDKKVVSNHFAKFMIVRFLEKYPELLETEEIYMSKALISTLVKAIEENKSADVTHCLKQDKRLLTSPLYKGQNLLSLSLTVSPEMLETVITLLGDRFARLPEASNNKGVELFYEAAHNLGVSGANLIAKQLSWTKKEFQNQLNAAIEAKDIKLAAICLELGADVNAKNSDEMPLLHQVILSGSNDLLQLFLESGADPELQNAYGDTALFVVVHRKDSLQCDLLLLHKADLEATDRAGNTPLHLAVTLETVEIIQGLLEAGADLEAVRPPENNTILLHVVQNNQFELLTLFLTHSDKKPNLDAVNQSGQNALHLAFELEHLDLIAPLVETGIDLEKKDALGNTALLRAVSSKQLDLLKLMLERPEKPSDIQAVNNNDENALHLAAQFGDTYEDHVLAMLLLDRGISAFALNKQGKKPQELAYTSGNINLAMAIDKKILDLRIQEMKELPKSSMLPMLKGIQKEDVIRFTDLTYGEALLGEGTFSQVFRGTCKGKEIAIKELLAPRLSVKAAEELGKEASIMRQLRHPNVIHMFGVCLEPGHYSLVLEYAPKGSLYDLHNMKQQDGSLSTIQLDWPLRWNIALGTARGIGHLHQHKPLVLHQDLKSPNVLLDEQYIPKIADFGLSRVRMQTQTSLRAKPSNQEKELPGTLAWMAPELFEPETIYGRACDVFSFGIILWELAVGHKPWKNAISEAQIPIFIGQGKREAIPQDTPPSYAKLITRCWAQRAKDRPSIEEAIQTLKTWRKEVLPVDIPEYFLCPITLEIMKEPYGDHDGNSFEKTAIETWLKNNNTSPLTRKPLALNDLALNRPLRDAIEHFLSEHPVLMDSSQNLRC